jgi:tetratricopeptide (TPR) repeat protein
MQAAAVVLVAGLLALIPLLLFTNFKNTAGNEKKDILRVWDAGDFDQAFEISKNALSSRPMDYFFFFFNGFSAYQLGISQINTHNTILFMDECIRSLRKALLLKESSADGRVYYVLGKAYSYKGDEYADLAIQYLENAGNLSYNAADISEYLGLAYAAIGDYRGSVEAFSRALGSTVKTTDALLLSIARSYMALEEFDAARAYLLRCAEISQDSKSVLTARFLLAEIFRKTGDHEGAESEYNSILNETGENAEAHYQLGELYNLKGDTTRARSEWRLAYKTDPAHAKARARLNI